MQLRQLLKRNRTFSKADVLASELTDPEEQRARFDSENRIREANGKRAYPPAEAFLRSLASMPPAAGNALGIDRLVMLFADTVSIDDVVAFTPETL